MSIEDLLNSLPSKEEITKALIGQTRNTGGDLLPTLGIFGAGMLLGAGLAIFLAPASGRQLRQDLAEKVSEVGRKLADGDKASTDAAPADISAA